MNIKELRELTNEKLQQEILTLRQSAFGLRVQLATQQHNKTSEKKRIKKLIAQAKTIQNEKIKPKKK